MLIRFGFCEKGNGKLGLGYGRPIISEDKLIELFNRVSLMRYDGLRLITDKCCEVAVAADVDQYFIPAAVDQDGIKYEMNYPSIEYCIFSLIMLMREYGASISGYLLSRMHSLFKHNGQTGFNRYMQSVIYVSTIKVTARRKISYIDIIDRMKSYSFTVAMESGFPAEEITEISDIYTSSRFNARNYSEYKPISVNFNRYYYDIVAYYLRATKLTDSYSEYIFYYRVIEYFFDSRVKERKSLKNVLKRYASPSSLMSKLQGYEDDLINYYKDNTVKFSSGSKLVWKNREMFYGTLGKRIYNTRNALVHSKRSQNENTYRPNQDEITLKKEIPLIRAVAELVIVGSASGFTSDS